MWLVGWLVGWLVWCLSPPPFRQTSPTLLAEVEPDACAALLVLPVQSAFLRFLTLSTAALLQSKLWFDWAIST